MRFISMVKLRTPAMGLFILRRRLPNASRPYRTIGYPITPVIFIAIEVWFIFNTLFEKPAESLAGIGFLLLGIPVYYLWKTKN